MVLIRLLGFGTVYCSLYSSNCCGIIVHDKGINLKQKQFRTYFMSDQHPRNLVKLFTKQLCISKFMNMYVPLLHHHECSGSFHMPWLVPWLLQSQTNFVSTHVFLDTLLFPLLHHISYISFLLQHI